MKNLVTKTINNTAAAFTLVSERNTAKGSIIYTFSGIFTDEHGNKVETPEAFTITTRADKGGAELSSEWLSIEALEDSQKLQQDIDNWAEFEIGFKLFETYNGWSNYETWAANVETNIIEHFTSENISPDIYDIFNYFNDIEYNFNGVNYLELISAIKGDLEEDEQ